MSGNLFPAQIKSLNFGTGPGCATQKFQAGLYAGVAAETADRDVPGHGFPAQLPDQFGQHGFKGDAFQGFFADCHGLDNALRNDKSRNVFFLVRNQN